jgi:hypothetical protein
MARKRRTEVLPPWGARLQGPTDGLLAVIRTERQAIDPNGRRPLAWLQSAAVAHPAGKTPLRIAVLQLAHDLVLVSSRHCSLLQLINYKRLFPLSIGGAWWSPCSAHGLSDRGLVGFVGAAAARVGRFSLLAVLILVADEDPASEAGAWSLVLGLGNFGKRTPYNIGVHNPPLGLWAGSRGAPTPAGPFPLSANLYLTIYVYVCL